MGVPTASRTRPITRSRGCSRAPAMASSSKDPEHQLLPPRTARLLERRGRSAPRPMSRHRSRRRRPPRLSLRFFAGPTPADVLRRFTRDTGRQPAPAAPWLFGPWVQPTGSAEQQAGLIDRLQAADAPLSVAQTYTHYLPCGSQRRQARCRAAADRGRCTSGGSPSPPTSTRCSARAMSRCSRRRLQPAG